MLQEKFLQISYDPAKKVWASVHYPYLDQIQGSLGEKFLKTMRSTDPNKIIDHFYDTNSQKTCKEVYEQSIIVAKNLQRLGIKKGDIVVFFCKNNADVAVLTMGCVLIGAVVNFFEVYLEEEHIDYVFNILKPNMILYEEKEKQACLQCLERINNKTCKYLISIDGQEQPNVKSELMTYNAGTDFDQFKSVEIKDPKKELVLLVLTSGSTGIPKIVPITHTLIMHGCYIWWNNENNYEPLSDESVIYSFSPLRWISQDIMLLQSMIMGIKRVSSCKDPTGTYGLELLSKTQITHLFVAPTIFQKIILQLNDNDVDSLKSLRMVQFGGESASRHLFELAKKHCVNAKIFQCYGMTEMATTITNDEDMNGGKLLPGYQIQILDEYCKPLGPNQKGQIALKTPFLFEGYKDINSKNHFNEYGFFINGDYGFVDEEKNLHVLARYKDLIYSNNLVLIPNYLEDCIMLLPEICTARLVGYRKTPQDGNDVAAFFIVLHKGVTISQVEVSKKIFDILKLLLKSEELAIVKEIYFVESVPVTTCGKVDRVTLKKLAQKKSLSK